jgi:hypothetical protein
MDVALRKIVSVDEAAATYVANELASTFPGHFSAGAENKTTKLIAGTAIALYLEYVERQRSYSPGPYDR